MNRSNRYFTKLSAVALTCAATAPVIAAPAAPALILPADGGIYDKTANYLSWSASGATNSRIVISSDKNFANFVDATETSYCTDATNCFTTTTGTAQYYKGNIPLGGPLWWKVRINSAQGASAFSAPRKVFVNPCSMTGAPKYSKQKVGTTYVFQVNLCNGGDLRAFTEGKIKTDGPYCGYTGVPTFPERTVREFINFEANKTTVNAGNLAISGSFHNDKGIPSYPQLIDGAMRTVGGYVCQPVTKRNLTINHSQKRAAIFAWTTLDDIKARAGQADVYTTITALDPAVNINATSIIGRNFACVSNPYNNAYGTVIFAVSSGATSSSIKTLLSDTYKCNASNMIQFDGSTVAQAAEKINGTSTWNYLIDPSDHRQMPQIFYVK